MRPNGGNTQNWHFYVILNRDMIKSIADTVQSSAETVASWPEAGQWKEEVTRQAQKSGFFRTAPAAIAITTGQYKSNVENICAAREATDPKARAIRQARNTADTKIQSVAAAISYLCLVLHQMGLGAVWMTGAVQSKSEIEKMLKVPAGMDFVAFLPVGYPGEAPALKVRKPVKEVSEVIK